jgi:molecular chaperone DnaJ
VDGQGFGGSAISTSIWTIFSGPFSVASAAGGSPTGHSAGQSQYRMNLDFMEAAFGVEREISVNKEDLCDHCQGTGAHEGETPETCSRCHGTGQVNTRHRPCSRAVMSSRPVRIAEDSGKIIHNPCTHCNGKRASHATTKKTQCSYPCRRRRRRDAVDARRRGTWRTGRSIRRSVIEIHVRPHPIFERSGANTFCEVPITYAQAALGG